MMAGKAKTEEDWDNLLPGVVNLQPASDYIQKIASEAKTDVTQTKHYVLRGTKKK
jgi:hypothetical protein